jgi:hypothetical protein
MPTVAQILEFTWGTTESEARDWLAITRQSRNPWTHNWPAVTTDPPMPTATCCGGLS